MAIAHVQTPAGGNSTGSATSLTLAFGSNVTAGNAIMVAWRYGGSGRTVTLSDTRSNTYTSNAIESLDATDGSTVGIGYALNISGGACTVTFAISGAAANLRVIASEFSGVATSSAIDKTAQASGTSASPASGAVTPTTNGQLFYATAMSANGETYTAGTDFALATTCPVTGGIQRSAAEYYIQPTAASHDGTFTKTNAANSWSCALATFKDTGAAPAFIPRRGINVMQAVNRAGTY